MADHEFSQRRLAAEVLSERRTAGPLGVAELQSVALAANPELARLRAIVLEERGRLQQAGLLPNPVLDAGQWEVPLDDGEGRGQTEVGLSQGLIIGGRRGRAVESARADIRVAESELAAAEARLCLEVEDAMVEVMYQWEAEGLAREILLMVEEDHALAASMGLHGEQLDREEKRAGVHIGELDLDVTKYTAERVFAVLALRRLVGTTELVPQDIDGALLRSMPRGILATNIREAAATHPERALAAARLGAAEARVRLARAEGVPDLTVRAVGGYDSLMDQGYAGAGVSIPVPIFDRNQGAVEAGRASAEAARHALEGTELDLEVRIDEALQRVTEFDTLATVGLDTLIPDAREAHARVRDDYAAGRATFLDLIDAQRTMIEVSYRTLAYRRDLHRFVAELEYLKGAFRKAATDATPLPALTIDP